jgi:hypothetical protein
METYRRSLPYPLFNEPRFSCRFYRQETRSKEAVKYGIEEGMSTKSRALRGAEARDAEFCDASKSYKRLGQNIKESTVKREECNRVCNYP